MVHLLTADVAACVGVRLSSVQVGYLSSASISALASSSSSPAISLSLSRHMNPEANAILHLDGATTTSAKLGPKLKI